MNRRLCFTALFICCIGITYNTNAQLPPTKTIVPNHPRLLCLQGEEKSILANAGKNDMWKKLHQTIISNCEATLQQTPVEHKKIGIRLLDKSRTCLRRVFYLAYAYRTTGDKKYLLRAEKEMLAVAAFNDWNPTHFLDVGEMTMALAIGYDWLYNDLSATSRKLISNVIWKNGIEPSLKPEYNSWLTSKGNWNQVCNAGIAYGAIATYEDQPERSQQIIDRAIAAVALPMQQYAPDGNYPEGYAYWEYGTSFNVMLISALQSAFQSDFGLTNKPGFLQTPVFLQNLYGSSGKPFNYADCGSRSQFNPTVLWFAAQTKDNTLLWEEKKNMFDNDSLDNRLLPAALIWGRNVDLDKVSAPINKMWIGKGINPVAMMRTSWTNPAAIFVGFKGGAPSNPHGHMDVGSFVMDANGERWAMDFGMQDYESLESKGLNLWNVTQASDRWKVFRYNNLAHNTLSVNNTFQKVDGRAEITCYSSNSKFLSATSDLTNIYDSLLQKSVRGIAIVDESYVTIRDEVETKEQGVTIRWSMVTPANVKIINDSTAELRQHGKLLLLKTSLPYDAKLRTWSTTPTTNFDAPNPGTTIIGFEIMLPAKQKSTLLVNLVPGQAGNKKIIPLNELAKWPITNNQ